MRVDDPRLAALAAETAGCSAVVSFVEESGDHRLFIAAALLEDGRVRHVHRKVHLPTYGLFDERRFFAAGRRHPGRAVAPGRGDRARRVRGLLAPRDGPDPRPRRGAGPRQRLVLAGARPGGHPRRGAGDRRLVAVAAADVRPADDERRRLLQPGRRRRVDQLLGRQRGDRAGRRDDRPGAALRRGPRLRGRSPWPTCAASGSPCRCCATSGRSCWSGSWSGSSPSGPGSPPTRRATRRPARERPGDPGRRGRRAGPGRAAALRAARGAPHRHRRRPAGHRRLHPRPAPPGRLRARRAGALRRDRLGARRVPRRRGDRPGAAAVRADALPDLVARLAGGRRGGGAPPRLRQPARRHQPDGRRLLRRWRRCARAPAGRRRREASPAAARQLHGPGPDDGPLRRVGDLGRARRRHRQQDRVAHRLHDRSSATAPAPSTRSATCTRPRCGSWRWRWGCPTRSSARRPRRTSGRARRTRPRRGSPTTSSTASSSG